MQAVNEISMLLDRKQLESASALQQTAFVMKEANRTAIIAIFILFEYNLRFSLVDELMGEMKKDKKSELI